MIIEIWDSKTGIFHEHDTGEFFEYEYWWEEGNGSCDCNRYCFLEIEIPEGEDPDTCHGNKRFIITENSLGFHFNSMNPGYPEELKKKALKAKKEKNSG